MKSIQLTEEHKTKLLEMCKVLFPEYPDLQFGVKEKHNWSKEYLVFGLTGNEPIIHWFEFCTITLWNELYLKLGNLELKSYYELLLNDLIHPVDYLYEEFKKLK